MIIDFDERGTPPLFFFAHTDPRAKMRYAAR